MTLTTTDIAREIAAEGQTVTLLRVATGSAPVSVSCAAMVRGFKPAELVGGIVQGDRRVVIAPTEIDAAGWPAPPRKGDVVVIDGTRTVVQGSETVRLRGDVAKYVLAVKG